MDYFMNNLVLNILKNYKPGKLNIIKYLITELEKEYILSPEITIDPENSDILIIKFGLNNIDRDFIEYVQIPEKVRIYFRNNYFENNYSMDQFRKLYFEYFDLKKNFKTEQEYIKMIQDLIKSKSGNI